MESDRLAERSACGTFAGTWGVFALGVAVLGSFGSVYLSIGMGLKACPLCFYQRSFMMAAAVSLATSLWFDYRCSNRACLSALPFTWAGLGVAGFHEYLVVSVKLECPPALFGWGDGPAQSLAVFSVLTALCLAGAWAGRRTAARQGFPTIIGTAILGVGLAWACVASAPPLPPRPAQPYDPVKQPFDMCRPPFPGV